MKQSLRMLALGFLISAVLLLVFDTFFSSSAQAEKSAEPKTTTTAKSADNASYKKKYEDLLAAQELAKSQAAEAQKAVAAKKKAEEEKAKQIKKFTLVIKKGDPSSKAGNELQIAGIIKSGAEFDKFLRANGYEKYVRDGSYALTSNMTADQIAKIITHKN
ncbi:hypothetical protein [Listeria grandensis]|uniref:hypothetical protein n=1 Tax=Listeria grandensis TaxID=1494963 RepID=UPI00164DA287|nr:hypothetical protein [Listeria grandensis]MBC6314629.1 endolytic transglycosylase MltG [Listeria grandensis]